MFIVSPQWSVTTIAFCNLHSGIKHNLMTFSTSPWSYHEAASTLSSNSLRVPEHHCRIIELFERKQLRVHSIPIVESMRLCRCIARIHIVQVRSEISLRLGIRYSIVEASNKWLDGRREGGTGVAGVAIMLEDPQRGTVRIR